MHMLSRATENVQPDCWEAIFFSAQVSKLEILFFFPSFIYACVSYLLLLVVLLVQELLFFLMVLKF